jgi:nicotinamidase/pyrazinamidase
MSKKKHILMIDPQNGFAKEVGDPNDLGAAFVQQQEEMDGELCVPGGMAALDNVAAAIEENPHAVDDWTITYDCHQELHISHPMWYRFVTTPSEQFVTIDGNPRMLYSMMTIRGQEVAVPGPFTTVLEKSGGLVIGFLDTTGQFVECSGLTTMHQGFLRWTLDYNAKLRDGGRYPHMIWPPHCRIGTPSNNLVDSIRRARRIWEHGEFGITTPITKGSNIKVEAFGAVAAEIIDPDDPTTMPNTHFVGCMSDEDQEIGICGLARGHCLANTAMDLAKQFPNPQDFMSRLVLLTDGTADVPNLEFLGDAFVAEATKLGMRTATVRDFLQS